MDKSTRLCAKFNNGLFWKKTKIGQTVITSPIIKRVRRVIIHVQVFNDVFWKYIVMKEIYAAVLYVP